MEEKKLLRKKHKAKSEGNTNALIAACTDLASLYLERGDYSSAINEYQIVASIYKEQENHLDFACVNRGIGEAYMLLNNYDLALQHQQIHLDISRNLANKIEEQRALATLGHIYLTKYVTTQTDKNDLNLAYKYFMRSLAICESFSNSMAEKTDMIGRLLCNLGVVQEFLGNYDKGKELFGKAINICEANDVFETLQRAYSSLASLLEKKGEYKEAIQKYKLALETAKKLKNKLTLMCSTLSCTSDILLKLGDFKAAKHNLFKAYKLLPKNHIEREEITRKLRIVVSLYRTEKELIKGSNDYDQLRRLYEHMGDGLCELNCFKQSIEYYKKLQTILEKIGGDLGPCYYSIAKSYKDVDEYEMAIKYYEKEYELCKDNLKNSLETLSEIADTKESAGHSLVDIRAIYDMAIKQCQLANNKREEELMMRRLMLYLRRSGKHTEAFEIEKRILTSDGSIPTDSESEDLESQSKTSIGDDICLESITDESDESASEDDMPATKKRRSKTMNVRRNMKGETQLHTACISGKINVVYHLLEQGHPVNIRDNGGWLPLHEACNAGHYEIVEMLIKKGATINDRGGTYCNGTTPLHDAAVNGHLKVIELLLDKGASVLSKTDDDETPYHLLKKFRPEIPFNRQDEHLYESLIQRMSTILDRAGQSKEVNVNLKNSALISKDDNEECHSSLGPDVNRKRKSKLRRNSSDEENIMLTNINKHKSSVPKTEATCEYQKVMDHIRNKPSGEINRPWKEKVKRPALVSADETDDDWLIDDMKYAQSHKRRKTACSELMTPCLRTSSMSSIDTEFSQRKLNIHNSSASLGPKSNKSYIDANKFTETHRNRSNSDDSINSEFAQTETEDRNENDIPVFEIFDTENFYLDDIQDDVYCIENRNPNKRQSNLLDAGFVRCTSPSETIQNLNRRRSKTKSQQPKISNFTSFKSRDITPNRCHVGRSSVSPNLNFSRMSPLKEKMPSAISSFESMLAIDVHIEGRPFRVTTQLSLKNTLTIKWLALEVARRYAKKEYVEPVLELTTKNGSELVDDDVIGSLFIKGTDEVDVFARVIKWNLPSIQNRYKDVCADMDIRISDALCKKLEEMSISLDISNIGLYFTTMAPLCKALSRETRLLELDLSNNFLSTDCIKLLCNSLPTLKNLAKLNISSTNIQSEDLRYLSDMFTTSSTPILQKLYSLNLSGNFFGDDSLPDIAAISENLTLKELNLSFLNFSDNIFKRDYNRNVKLVLQNIEFIDISGNSLSTADMEQFISFLKSSRLRILDVSRNKLIKGSMNKIVSLLSPNEERLNFENLNLAGCPVEDSEVFNLIRTCDNLENINLSYTNVTSVTLRRLLESSIVRNINLLGCDYINDHFDSELTYNLADYCEQPKSLKINMESEKLLILINTWKEKFSDRIKVEVMDNYLSILPVDR